MHKERIIINACATLSVHNSCRDTRIIAKSACRLLECLGQLLLVTYGTLMITEPNYDVFINMKKL